MVQIIIPDSKSISKFIKINNIDTNDNNVGSNNKIKIKRKISFRCMNGDKFECSLCVHFNKTCEKCEHDSKIKKLQ